MPVARADPRGELSEPGGTVPAMGDWHVAIDVGGTFTDAIARTDDGHLRTAKVRTRPSALADGVLEALAALETVMPSPAPRVAQIRYGTTLATNALLEHRLAPIALIITAGFREILEINGVHDEDHHEPGSHAHARPRLVPLEDIHEVRERLDGDGRIRVPLDPHEVERIAKRIIASGRTFVAVALLHSYREACHERAVRDILARCAPTLRVVLSSEVLPELREYERTVITCLNTALLPLMQDHLRRITTGEAAPLLLMKASGGLGAAARALDTPLATVLSGPSAAVLNACHVARQCALEHAISLDIGGTSTDVALIEHGQYRTVLDAEVAGYPLKTPAIDLVTIGAGGGSIARDGRDRRWRVGPQSAGAEPGPACYGRGGTEVTLTDIHLALGRLSDRLLDGAVRLDPDAARTVLSRFGAARGLDGVQTAQGLLQIVTNTMCGAIRRLAARRGRRPEMHALIAQGGAGPLHAAELAGLLGAREVVVPPLPGFAAAQGLLMSAVREDAVQNFPQREHAFDIGGTEDCFARLENEVCTRLATFGFARDAITLTRGADVRYVGMTSEFPIPVSTPITRTALATVVEEFHRTYEAFCGRAYRGLEAVELVNLRVTGTIAGPALPAQAFSTVARDPRPLSTRDVYFLDARAPVQSPVYRRETLGPGIKLEGPLVIEQQDTTTLVPPGFSAHTDEFGNLRLVRHGSPT